MPSYKPIPSNREILDKDFGYEYPEGMDLKPGTEQHDKILQSVMDRAFESRSALSNRFDQWKTTDEIMTSFIPKKEEERIEKEEDPRRPVAIVVPLSYAIEDAIITYLMQMFLKDVYFSYDGIGPEDQYGAFLLQHHIQQQCLRAKVELALATQWQDAYRYGVGLIAPNWETQIGPKVVREVQGFRNNFGEFVETGTSTSVEKVLFGKVLCLITSPHIIIFQTQILLSLRCRNRNL